MKKPSVQPIELTHVKPIAPMPLTNAPTTLKQKVVHTIKILLGAAVAFLGAQLAAPFVLSALVLSFGVKGKALTALFDSNVYIHFALILAVEAFTVWFVMILLRRSKWRWQDIGLGRKPTWGDLSRGIQVYGIYFLIFIAVYALESATHLINLDQAQRLGFDNTHGIQLVAVFFSLVILPPIAEEILFRGYIFMGLRKKLPFIYSALITSALFGIAHLEFGSGSPLNWAAAIDTFTLSCVLTYAVEKNRSLWPNMIVHAMKNLLAFILLFVIR